MKAFLKRDDGAVALIFAVMAIPFIAMAGWAVDYLRLQHVKDFLQAQADSAALNAMIDAVPNDEINCLIPPNEQWKAIFNAAMAQQYNASWASDPEIDGNCLNSLDFQVTTQADVPLVFIKLLPGIGDTQRVAASATARLVEPVTKRGAPESTFLDSEAGDFNRLWMYCYWPNRPENDPQQPKRTQMVPIADNGGSTFIADFGTLGEHVVGDPPEDGMLADEYWAVKEAYEYGIDGREEGIWRIESGAGTGNRTYRYFMPTCGEGSHLSFRLENVRFARQSHQFWDSGAPVNRGGDGHTGRFNYYTDTSFTVDGVEQYEDLTHPDTGQPVNIVETVLCDTKEECTKKSEGGIVPEGRGREPERAEGRCVSTADQPKYMYYGWEDRPPGLSGANGSWQDYAWTDRDFDDITIVIQCPYFEVSGDRNSRLIG